MSDLDYNSLDDINPINNYGNSPFAVRLECLNCACDANESGYCDDCELLILEGKL
jgi:hypothetical protein